MTVPIFSNRQGSAWTPRALGSSLVQWLRADMGVITDGGSPERVITWSDQSGNGHHATQGTAGSRPTFSPTLGPNGGPSIESDTLSATPWLDVNSAIPTVPSITGVGWTIIVICTCRTAPGTAASFISTTTAVTPADGSALQIRRDSGNRATVIQASVLPAPTFLTVTNPDFNPVGTWLASVMVVDASENRTLHVYGDGTSATVTDAKTSNTNVEIATKRIFREGATYYQSLGVSEIICVNRAVTASELANIAAYVKRRGVV